MEKSNNNEERIFHKIIKEICKEKGINCEKLSYDWVLQLTKNNEVRHISGNRFDINPESSGRIACDKYATYSVLKSQNIPVVDHKMVFNPVSRKEYINEKGIWNDILQYFYDNNQKVVVKPNSGCEGNNIYLCENIRDLENAISKIFKSNGTLSLCPYYEISTEYRTFYLNGTCEFMYGKVKPRVIGNGVNTVAELIKIQNEKIPDNEIVDENLKEINLEYIPKENEIFYLSWKHNLSGGALPILVEDEILKQKIEELVKKAGIAMNMNFASIDVIETVDSKLYILEINSGVCMRHFIDNFEDGYNISKNIYSKAIDQMFKRK